jgi:hypothetical protein
MPLPILDPRPSGKPHDWNYNKIAAAGPPVVAPYPPEFKNPLVGLAAPRDQADRGTCVGQSTAYCFDLLYMKLTGDLPTDEDKAEYKKDVTDTRGTIHDILFPQSASAECFYQISRQIGNVTYPAGSEIRFSARAWTEYGMVPEKFWHTDKTAHAVQLTPDDPILCKAFAEDHRAEGYAVVYGWDAICEAISTKGFVLGAIPIYENFSMMEGGDGTFPDPRGEIAGYHALCFYGYDPDNLYLIHSWGDFCGRFGSISKRYFQLAEMDEIHFMVILDEIEVRIARQLNASLFITCNVPAQITVNGVLVGNSPQKIAIEHGKTYQITASARGYVAQTKSVDDSVQAVVFTLEPVPEPVKKSWFQIIIEFLMRLFKR